jgi:hypothetical protein
LPDAGQLVLVSVPGTILPRPEADARREDGQMTGTGRHSNSNSNSNSRSTLRSRGSGTALKAAAGRLLRLLMPPIGPRVIFRALLGVLMFFVGIVFGCWLIIRFRRHFQRQQA